MSENIKAILMPVAVGFGVFIVLWIALNILWNKKWRPYRISQGRPTPSFSNIVKRVIRFNLKEDVLPLGKIKFINHPRVYLILIGVISALIFFGEYIVSSVLAIGLLLYISGRTKNVFNKRNEILDRMFQIAVKHITYPREAALNPWAYINIKEWFELYIPGETVVVFPPSFRADQPIARENLENHFNAIVSESNSWIYEWDLPQGRLICKPVKHIPKFVEYPGSEKSSWDKIPMGVGAAGEVFWDVSTAPHALICGTTGGGKSMAQKTIIFHTIQHSDKWDFLGIDLKRVELSAFKKYDTVKGIATELEDAVEILRYAKDSLMQRFEQMEEMGVTHFKDLPNPPKALMVMIDEAYELLASVKVNNEEGKQEDEYKAECIMLIGRIARLGRAAGVHLVLATQRPDAKVIYGEIKENLMVRYAAGPMKNTASLMVLDSASATRTPGEIKGRAIISVLGHETILQGYYTPGVTDWIDQWLSKKSRKPLSESGTTLPFNVGDGEISYERETEDMSDDDLMERFNSQFLGEDSEERPETSRQELEGIMESLDQEELSQEEDEDEDFDPFSVREKKEKTIPKLEFKSSEEKEAEKDILWDENMEKIHEMSMNLKDPFSIEFADEGRNSPNPPDGDNINAEEKENYTQLFGGLPRESELVAESGVENAETSVLNPFVEVDSPPKDLVALPSMPPPFEIPPVEVPQTPLSDIQPKETSSESESLPLPRPKVEAEVLPTPVESTPKHSSTSLPLPRPPQNPLSNPQSSEREEALPRPKAKADVTTTPKEGAVEMRTPEPLKNYPSLPLPRKR